MKPAQNPALGESAWRYKDGGVVCLVRDQTLRSCFLRLYSVKIGKLLWEQELYTTFKYSAPRPFFHSFLADDCQAGLNFRRRGRSGKVSHCYGHADPTHEGKGRRGQTAWTQDTNYRILFQLVLQEDISPI
ncbi:wiskott-Aldrich syndrome protein [Brienomyrus brachyistius]|uniref:wiskott-Aldrich syndrome protein n=1 Tax=Brienomyrus brachyistius TaxID=42636 RepID=UPI0020B32CF9|nr:wiskott-Aldrich syndrome protein [Brienomyrus brachyistius]